MKNKIFSTRFAGAKQIICSLLIVLAITGQVAAQPDGADNVDTPSLDYYDENIDLNNFEGTDDKPDEPKKPEKKPYVRIKLPMDTITELISYESVIAQETSYSDSLYIRGKRWVISKWGVPYATKKKDMKDNEAMFIEDLMYEKFKAVLKVPLRVRYNKFSSSDYGELRFTLTMRFKEGKYKYTITNLTHLLPETSDKKDINYVYMEFYMKSERNIVTYDRYLRGADGAIQKMVKEMLKFMKEPAEVDEDDW